MTLAARSGLARSNATRAGYDPFVVTIKPVPLYALSRIARSGATRSNYTSGVVFITVGGIPVGGGGVAVPGSPRVLDESLSITDPLNETPTTARMTQHFGNPHVGDAVVVTLGSTNNGRKEFAGTVLRCRSYYVGTPANPHFDLDCIDDTEGMDTRRLWARYVGQTVATIATSLVTTYAPGYTLKIDPAIGAIVINQISFADRPVSDALTQLMKRAGSHWKCDYGKVVTIGPDGGTDPRLINAVHPTLLDVDVTRDYSQVVTRVLSEGGGGATLTLIPAGETKIPLDTTTWYEPSGEVTSGDQRVSYASVDAGGGGSLVGPGAVPTGTPSLALAPGAGVNDGSHVWAVTFVTAAGETLVGPGNGLTVGSLAPPAAPGAGAPQGGSGPDVGVHAYAVSFVTASGETPPGPSVSVTTTAIASPTTAPTASGPTLGGSIDPGLHDYAVTYVTPQGETTPSPISDGVQTMTGVDAMAVPPPPGASTSNGSGLALGTYQYAVTAVNANGETTPSSSVQITITSTGVAQVTLNVAQAGGMQRRIYRTTANGGALKLLTTLAGTTTAYVDTSTDSVLGGAPPSSNTTGANYQTITLTAIAAPGYTRRLYRRSGGAGLRLLVTLDAVMTSWIDASPNSSLGAAPPSTTTAVACQVPLTLPLGGALVTARKVWGTAAGQAQLKLVATVGDNTTTTYLVTTVDAALGANAPTSNTATANQVALSAIPIGASAVTARRLYRSAANTTTPLKLVVTLGDNVTTTYTDATADASLGAAAPTGDTSGLQQPAGVVPQGATTVPVASVGAFRDDGGWAVIGNGEQVIRYATRTGNALTGIPAAGAGAIVATVAYNSTITAAPLLVGVPVSGAGALRFALQRGDAVNLLVVENDVAAQAALARLVGGDGVQEDSLSDNRLSATEARARARAWLALRKDVDVSVRAVTRDRNTASGRTLTVNLGAFDLHGETFTIQAVTVSTFTPRLQPHYSLQASSVRFTFDDWQRMLLERT